MRRPAWSRFRALSRKGWTGSATRSGLNVGADAALASVPHPLNPNYPLVPDFQTAKNATYSAWGGTEYQPETWLGRRGMDAATAGVLAATDPYSIPAAMGAGAAGGEGAELLPDHPIIGALAGGLFGGIAVNGLLNTGQRIGTAIGNTNPNDIYGAFRRKGLPTGLAGTTTGDPMLLAAEKQASRLSGTAGRMATGRETLTNAWQDRLNQIADSMGNSSSTPAEAWAGAADGRAKLAKQLQTGHRTTLAGFTPRFQATRRRRSPITSRHSRMSLASFQALQQPRQWCSLAPSRTCPTPSV